jgi:two-component system, NarL family, nitrate/nitrite response regulator NarL
MRLATYAESVSPRQKQILALIIKGLTNKEIAACLRVSVPAIKQQLRFLYLKFDVANRTQLALRAAGLQSRRQNESKDRRVVN